MAWMHRRGKLSHSGRGGWIDMTLLTGFMQFRTDVGRSCGLCQLFHPKVSASAFRGMVKFAAAQE